jgi:DNA-binding transcriptional MerR regulator
VNELRQLPLERLLPRMHSPPSAESPPNQRRLYEEATQPELLSWIERNPERAQQFTPDEIEELLSLQGTGGPLTAFGVEHYVEVIERKRVLVRRVNAIAGTEYLEFLEKFVELLYEKVQPYANR